MTIRPGARIVAALPWLLLAPGLGWAILRTAGAAVDLTAQLMAFTPYAALWSVLAFGVAAVLRKRVATLVAGLAAALLVGALVPRATANADGGPQTGVTVRVLTANMLAGQADAATLVRLVRDNQVGILALQEFTREAQARLTAAGLDTLLPYAVRAPQLSTSPSDTTGSALYSRTPITGGGVHLNTGGFQQAYGRIAPDGAGPLLVESVHALAPVDGQAVRSWRADLAHEPVPAAGQPPQLLIGDFNSTLDHAPFRALVARGYRDAADTVGAGLHPTWGPYGIRPVRLITIDHVLADRRVGVVDATVLDVPRSDHRPVLATLRVPVRV